MRRVIVLFGLGVALMVGIACSKKSSPPNAPQAPACQVLPTSLDFGSVEVGSLSTTKAFSLTNSGGGTLSGTVAESCPDFEIVTGAGSYSLTAGQRWAVTVRFRPVTAGNKSCAVSTGCSQGVALTGIASNQPCALNPGSLAFGSVTVGQSADKTFTLQNTGSATLSGTLTESCSDFAIVGSPAYALTAGQTATFTIRFSPPQAGPQSCVITTGSAGCPQISCSGTGATGCTYQPTAFDFGYVLPATTQCRSLTL